MSQSKALPPEEELIKKKIEWVKFVDNNVELREQGGIIMEMMKLEPNYHLTVLYDDADKDEDKTYVRTIFNIDNPLDNYDNLPLSTQKALLWLAMTNAKDHGNLHLNSRWKKFVEDEEGNNEK
jgi:hypothetical protein